MTGVTFPSSTSVVRYSRSSVRSFAITARSRWCENAERTGALQDLAVEATDPPAASFPADDRQGAL